MLTAKRSICFSFIALSLLGMITDRLALRFAHYCGSVALVRYARCFVNRGGGGPAVNKTPCKGLRPVDPRRKPQASFVKGPRAFKKNKGFL